VDAPDPRLKRRVDVLTAGEAVVPLEQQPAAALAERELQAHLQLARTLAQLPRRCKVAIPPRVCASAVTRHPVNEPFARWAQADLANGVIRGLQPVELGDETVRDGARRTSLPLVVTVVLVE